MKNAKVTFLTLLALAAMPSARAAHSYEPARLGRKLEFPRDHGAHRQAAYEWWYWTGHSFLPDGSPRYGFQLTLFRISPVAGPKLATSQSRASSLIAHLAISDLVAKRHFHRAFGVQEGASWKTSESRLEFEVPGFRVIQDGAFGLLQIQARWEVEGKPFRIEGTLQNAKPWVLHGQDGFSRKGNCETCASHYVSATRLKGKLVVQAAGLASEPLRTEAWFDHEFGSNALAKAQAGWDWFAIQLASGWELMLFQLRKLDGSQDFMSGTWVDPQGRSGSLPAGSFEILSKGNWKSPQSGARYPGKFELRLKQPPQGLPERLEVVPRFPEQEVFGGDAGLATYWEGSCEIRAGGSPVGQAYLEMTGYDPSRRPRF